MAKKPKLLDVDPASLRVPSTRIEGADATKLARQVSKFGKSTTGMPPLEVIRCKNGILQINDGVTRATRVAKLLPGRLIRVEVIQEWPNLDVSRFPTIGAVLP